MNESELLDTGRRLLCQVHDNPFDADLRLVYSDYLGEIGELGEQSCQKYLAAAIKLLRPADLAGIKESLAIVNGRRRERILSIEAVLGVVWATFLNDVPWCALASGKPVSGSYGYQASRTVCVAAVRTDGTVRVGITVTSGSKGVSPTYKVTGLPKTAKPEQFRAWADRG